MSFITLAAEKAAKKGKAVVPSEEQGWQEQALQNLRDANVDIQQRGVNALRQLLANDYIGVQVQMAR